MPNMSKGTLYRGRYGMWSWVAHRVTGIAIFFFLLVHVLDTAVVRISPEAYNSVLSLYKNPIMGLGRRPSLRLLSTTRSTVFALSSLTSGARPPTRRLSTFRSQTRTGLLRPPRKQPTTTLKSCGLCWCCGSFLLPVLQYATCRTFSPTLEVTKPWLPR